MTYIHCKSFRHIQQTSLWITRWGRLTRPLNLHTLIPWSNTIMFAAWHAPKIMIQMWPTDLLHSGRASDPPPPPPPNKVEFGLPWPWEQSRVLCRDVCQISVMLKEPKSLQPGWEVRRSQIQSEWRLLLRQIIAGGLTGGFAFLCPHTFRSTVYIQKWPH